MKVKKIKVGDIVRILEDVFLDTTGEKILTKGKIAKVVVGDVDFNLIGVKELENPYTINGNNTWYIEIDKVEKVEPIEPIEPKPYFLD